jgi:hypothetical protein
MELPVEFDLKTWSGTAPFFPLPAYRVFVSEATKSGSRLLRARATNRMGKEMFEGEWTYRLVNNDEVSSCVLECTGSK